jgi:hypothetical protein
LPLNFRRLPFAIILALAVIALVAFQASRAGGQVEGVVGRVLDGDTLVVGSTKIRLQGIAAPELDEPLGPEARDFLTALVLGKRARCEAALKISISKVMTAGACALWPGSQKLSDPAWPPGRPAQLLPFGRGGPGPWRARPDMTASEALAAVEMVRQS